MNTADGAALQEGKLFIQPVHLEKRPIGMTVNYGVDIIGLSASRQADGSILVHAGGNNRTMVYRIPLLLPDPVLPPAAAPAK